MKISFIKYFYFVQWQCYVRGSPHPAACPNIAISNLRFLSLLSQHRCFQPRAEVEWLIPGQVCSQLSTGCSSCQFSAPLVEIILHFWGNSLLRGLSFFRLSTSPSALWSHDWSVCFCLMSPRNPCCPGLLVGSCWISRVAIYFFLKYILFLVGSRMKERL